MDAPIFPSFITFLLFILSHFHLSSPLPPAWETLFVFSFIHPFLWMLSPPTQPCFVMNYFLLYYAQESKKYCQCLLKVQQFIRKKQSIDRQLGSILFVVINLLRSWCLFILSNFRTFGVLVLHFFQNGRHRLVERALDHWFSLKTICFVMAVSSKPLDI